MPKWASGPTGHPSYWRRAKKELSTADPVMADIIKGCGRGGLIGQGDPFVTLVRSIVAQQISVRAADSIWNRLEETAGGISPKKVAARNETELHGAGLPRRKAYGSARNWPMDGGNVSYIPSAAAQCPSARRYRLDPRLRTSLRRR